MGEGGPETARRLLVGSGMPLRLRLRLQLRLQVRLQLYSQWCFPRDDGQPQRQKSPEAGNQRNDLRRFSSIHLDDCAGW